MRLLQAALAAATTAALALPVQAATPSFDCRKATHEAEQMICKDAELSDLDHQLDALYNHVLARAPAGQRATLKAEQRGWIKGRNDCWKSSDQRGCIKSAYEERIGELESR